MNTASLTVRRHTGKAYGGGATKRGHDKKPASPSVTKVVRKESPPKQTARLGIKLKKEEAKDVTYLQWAEKYRTPRIIVLTKTKVAEALAVKKKWKSPLDRDLSINFARVAQNHFEKYQIDQVDIEIRAKGAYPMNPSAGTFFRVAIAGRESVIPTSFLEAKTK
jgi:hypothetical protein